MKRMILVIFAGLLAPAMLLCQGQNPEAAAAHRLLTARSIYVEPMPDGLDQWIIQDLKAWGRYQVSPTLEGVDLVIRAKKPNNKVLETEHGILPSIRRPKAPLPVLSLTVVDWVTQARVWQADILNASRKGDGPSASGPRAEIYARHMKPDQIAERATNALRRYVEQLQQNAGAKD